MPPKARLSAARSQEPGRQDRQGSTSWVRSPTPTPSIGAAPKPAASPVPWRQSDRPALPYPASRNRARPSVAREEEQTGPKPKDDTGPKAAVKRKRAKAKPSGPKAAGTYRVAATAGEAPRQPGKPIPLEIRREPSAASAPAAPKTSAPRSPPGRHPYSAGPPVARPPKAKTKSLIDLTPKGAVLGPAMPPKRGKDGPRLMPTQNQAAASSSSASSSGAKASVAMTQPTRSTSSSQSPLGLRKIKRQVVPTPTEATQPEAHVEKAGVKRPAPWLPEPARIKASKNEAPKQMKGDATQRQDVADLEALRAAKALAAQKDKARSGLQAAVNSRDITALSAAIKEAEETGLPDKDLREAQQTLEHEERKQAARKALADAISSKDCIALQAAIDSARAANVAEKDLHQAEQTLKDEERKQASRAALSAAIASREIGQLRSALAQAANLQGASLSEEELQPAKTVLAQLERYAAARANLEKALASDDANLLRSTIARAERCGVGPEPLADARATLQKWEDRAAVLEALKEAVKSKDVQKLRSAMDRGVAAGLTVEELAAAWEALGAEEGKARARSLLQKAIDSRDVDQLQNAINEGKSAGLGKSELEAGEIKLLALQAKAQLRRELQDAISRCDAKALEAKIKPAQDLGLTEDVARAKQILAQEIRKIGARSALKEAIQKKDVRSLRSAIDEGEKADLDIKELDEARGVLQALQHEKARQQLRDAWNSRRVENLTAAIKAAKDAGLKEEGDDTLAQAVETLKKIQAAQQRLRDAASSRDVTALKGALQEAQETGLPDKDLREAQQTLEDEERKQAARKALSDAIHTRDCIALQAAIDSARAANLAEKDLHQAEQVLKDEERKQASRAALSAAIASRDINLLQSAVTNAKQANLQANEQLFFRAEMELKREIRRAPQVAALRQAIESRDVEQLRKALKDGEGCCDKQDLTKASQVLAEEEAKADQEKQRLEEAARAKEEAAAARIKSALDRLRQADAQNFEQLEAEMQQILRDDIDKLSYKEADELTIECYDVTTSVRQYIENCPSNQEASSSYSQVASDGAPSWTTQDNLPAPPSPPPVSDLAPELRIDQGSADMSTSRALVEATATAPTSEYDGWSGGASSDGWGSWGDLSVGFENQDETKREEPKLDATKEEKKEETLADEKANSETKEEDEASDDAMLAEALRSHLMPQEEEASKGQEESGAPEAAEAASAEAVVDEAVLAEATEPPSSVAQGEEAMRDVQQPFPTKSGGEPMEGLHDVDDPLGIFMGSAADAADTGETQMKDSQQPDVAEEEAEGQKEHVQKPEASKSLEEPVEAARQPDAGRSDERQTQEVQQPVVEAETKDASKPDAAESGVQPPHGSVEKRVKRKLPEARKRELRSGRRQIDDAIDRAAAQTRKAFGTAVAEGAYEPVPGDQGPTAPPEPEAEPPGAASAHAATVHREALKKWLKPAGATASRSADAVRPSSKEQSEMQQRLQEQMRNLEELKKKQAEMKKKQAMENAKPMDEMRNKQEEEQKKRREENRKKLEEARKKQEEEQKKWMEENRKKLEEAKKNCLTGKRKQEELQTVDLVNKSSRQSAHAATDATNASIPAAINESIPAAAIAALDSLEAEAEAAFPDPPSRDAAVASASEAASPTQGSPHREEGRWQCSECGEINRASRTECNNCSALRSTSTLETGLFRRQPVAKASAKGRSTKKRPTRPLDEEERNKIMYKKIADLVKELTAPCAPCGKSESSPPPPPPPPLQTTQATASVASSSSAPATAPSASTAASALKTKRDVEAWLQQQQQQQHQQQQQYIAAQWQTQWQASTTWGPTWQAGAQYSQQHWPQAAGAQAPPPARLPPWRSATGAAGAAPPPQHVPAQQPQHVPGVVPPSASPHQPAQPQKKGPFGKPAFERAQPPADGAPGVIQGCKKMPKAPPSEPTYW